MPEGAPLNIIIGLGNPGKKYERTRHNAGFLAVDVLAAALHAAVMQAKHNALIGKAHIADKNVVLVKPQTYMNESGRAVAAILRDSYATAGDLIVLHDELDLPLGIVRVKIGGGHGGHNGLRSLIEHLGSPDFVRVRIGINRPAPGMDAADYVLSPFFGEEKQVLAGALTRAAEAVHAVILEGPAKAMNLFNQK